MDDFALPVFVFSALVLHAASAEASDADEKSEAFLERLGPGAARSECDDNERFESTDYPKRARKQKTVRVSALAGASAKIEDRAGERARRSEVENNV